MQNVHDAAMPQEVDEFNEAGIDRLIAGMHQASLYVALLVAWVATSGSLFMSNVLLWIPCELCWYQRILMYPLALILPVAILRRDRAVLWYALPLSLFGAGIALYHYLLTKTNLFPVPPCTGSVPCNFEYMNVFGFINVPFMALVAFVIISVMVFGAALSDVDEGDDAAETTIALPVPLRQQIVPLVAMAVIIFGVLGTFLLLRGVVVG